MTDHATPTEPLAQEGKLDLEGLAREGARRILQQAIGLEVDEYIEGHKNLRDDAGHRVVVRNGSMPERELVSGIGPIPIHQPRVDDRRPGQHFTSAILPPYLRRLPTVDALIPALYLKGVSTGDFSEVLQVILGERASGLSPTSIVRLKAVWEDDYKAWCKRDLTGKRYVYWWVDGIYFNVRLTDDRPCILVIMGALPDGTKELVAVWDGQRESKLSWKEVILDLKSRGLTEAPRVAVGDGALGFWAALEEDFPSTRGQRCWVHKTVNVLDKMPKKLHPSVKSLIYEMYRAETKKDALEAFERFGTLYGVKHPEAWKCLESERIAQVIDGVIFVDGVHPAEIKTAA